MKEYISEFKSEVKKQYSFNLSVKELKNISRPPIKSKSTYEFLCLYALIVIRNSL